MTTPPTTLHERLRAELDRRLAVARAADGWTWNCESSGLLWSRKPDEPEIAITHGGVEGPRWLREYIALHDPADAIRRYTGELEVLERHVAEFFEDSSLTEALDLDPNEPWCRTCRGGEWPCADLLSLASRLGVSVDG